jgi:uncharacterized protein involved in exopolysaccharide biosynthesis
MDPHTERLIRADIKARWAPPFILLWLFLGSIAGFAVVGGLGLLIHFLETHGY